MIRRLVATPNFHRDARRLAKRDRAIASRIEDALRLLAADAFAPALRTHKLKGDLQDRLSCSAGYDLRIHFRIVRDGLGECVELLAAGTHDEVY